MSHYFLEDQTDEIKHFASEYKLKGPVFVGQGCTYSVGSDSYGYYVAEILEPGWAVALVGTEHHSQDGRVQRSACREDFGRQRQGECAVTTSTSIISSVALTGVSVTKGSDNG